MYLSEIYIESVGPLRRFSLEFPFGSDGLPKPVVLVGQNGSGKTTVLSVVADALFEGAAPHYTDVVSSSSGISRNWFRVGGGSVITTGSPGACAILRFSHDNTDFFFRERSGKLPVSELLERMPQSLRSAMNWGDDEATAKDFMIPEKQAREIYHVGAHVFFPSSRAEIPHWLNIASGAASAFNLRPRFSNELSKPIYVERAFDKLKQWLFSVLLDSRVDFDLQINHANPGAGFQPVVRSGWKGAHGSKAVWDGMNSILRVVLNDAGVALGWTGRTQTELVVHRQGVALNPSIDSLSAGQTGLMNVFGTLLRYGDSSGAGFKVQGICLIDEVDAHTHVDLQHRALPALMKLFPKIQFIVTSHSPLFVLGVEKAYGTEGVVVLDMPTGTPIPAEAFAEFGNALAAMRDTVAFSDSMAVSTSAPGKLLVFMEGETDPLYMQAAAEVLNRANLTAAVEFQWIGAKQEAGGQAFNTGKSALNTAFNLFRAKPALLQRAVLLLYDNDVSKELKSFDSLHVRSMPSNRDNDAVSNGIENLLPASSIPDVMYNEKTTKNPAGGKTIILSLDKMRLCRHLCLEKRDPADFEGFKAVLDMIAEIAGVAIIGGGTSINGANKAG